MMRPTVEKFCLATLAAAVAAQPFGMPLLIVGICVAAIVAAAYDVGRIHASGVARRHFEARLAKSQAAYEEATAARDPGWWSA